MSRCGLPLYPTLETALDIIETSTFPALSLRLVCKGLREHEQRIQFVFDGLALGVNDEQPGL
jgi:hypothetical protein